METNLSRPEAIGQVDPEVFDLLLEKYRNTEKTAIYPVRFLTRTPRDNTEVLEALGNFKSDVIEYVQDAHRRFVAKATFVVDVRDVTPGRQQRATNYHLEFTPDGTTIVSASTLPTIFIAQKNLSDNPRTYLNYRYNPYANASTYSAEDIMQGVEDGVLEKYQPLPGEMIELDNRIHCSPVNTTGELVRRAFLACELLFGKKFR